MNVPRTAFPALLFLLAAALLRPGAAPAAPPVVEIVVQKGDTLNELCKQHLADPGRCGEIARFNQLRDPNRIEPGEKLLVPLSFLKVRPEEPVEASVTFVKGSVSARGTDSGPWQAIDRGATLRRGNQVMTGPDGTAELSFDDASTLLLRPGTMVTLTALKRREDGLLRKVFLGIGRLLSSSRGAGTEVETTTAVAGSRGTRFGAAMLGDGTMTTEVREGAIAVAAMGKEVEVHAGEGTLVKQGSPPEAPRPLLPPPAATDLRPLYASLPFELHFAPVAGAVTYRIALAADAEGRDIVLEKIIAPAEPFRVAELAEGTYSLLARSIDEQGLEGLDPQPQPLTLRIEPVSPPPPAPPPPPPQAEGSRMAVYVTLVMVLLAMLLF